MGAPRASLPTEVATHSRGGGGAWTEPLAGTSRAQILRNVSSAAASREILHHVTATGTSFVTSSRAQRIRAGVSGLHPGYFALVMATGIMSIGTSTAGVGWLSLSLLWLAVICYLVLVLLLACRLIAFRDDLVNDLSDPARAFGFFTFVAATNVIGARLVGDGHREVVVGLLAVSSLAWLFLGYLIPAMVAHRPRTDPALRGVNGSWFIWVVASQSIAVLAATLEPQVEVGRRELALVAVFSWSVGLFLYGTVGVLVVVRLLLFKIQPDEVTPPYWVAMGATAISVVAGSKIVEMAKAPMVTATSALIAGLAVLFWAFGTWLIPALLAVGYWRHIRHRVPLVYEPSMWSIVFPLGMYGVGSAYLGEVDDLPIVNAIGHAEIWVALAVWAIVFGAMLHHLARTVFRADPPR